MASNTWLDLFPDAKLTHVVSSRSDQLPLLLELEKTTIRPNQGENQRYEAMWERDSSIFDAIEEAWSASPGCSNLSDLMGKVNKTRGHLKVWNVEVFGKVTKEIKNRR